MFTYGDFRLVGLREGMYLHQHQSSMRFVSINSTPHTRLRARVHNTSSILMGGKGGAGPSSLHTTLEGPAEYVDARWIYVASNGSRPMVTWTIIKNHLLEVGLTQNRETMVL